MNGLGIAPVIVVSLISSGVSIAQTIIKNKQAKKQARQEAQQAQQEYQKYTEAQTRQNKVAINNYIKNQAYQNASMLLQQQQQQQQQKKNKNILLYSTVAAIAVAGIYVLTSDNKR